MYRHIWVWPGVGLLLTLLSAGCATPLMGTGPTPTLKPAATGLTAQELLRRTVQRLEAAASYKVKITLNHRWRFEGSEQSWDFTGEAQYAKPNRFRSRLEGPADSSFLVDINGDEVAARDMRGEVPQATKAFGGPGVGTAPYTAINYLKRFDRADDVAATSLNGVSTYRITFVPSLQAVAALDAGHAQIMPQVRSVKGTAWIEAQSYLVRKLVLEIEFATRSGDTQHVVTTLEFFDFDQPVEFK